MSSWFHDSVPVDARLPSRRQDRKKKQSCGNHHECGTRGMKVFFMELWFMAHDVKAVGEKEIIIKVL